MRRVEFDGEREVTAPGSAAETVDAGPRAFGSRAWTARFAFPTLTAPEMEEGEEHESGSDVGMTALVIEAESLDV